MRNAVTKRDREVGSIVRLTEGLRQRNKSKRKRQCERRRRNSNEKER